jgi:hypothetical protein
LIALGVEAAALLDAAAFWRAAAVGAVGTVVFAGATTRRIGDAEGVGVGEALREGPAP